MPLDVTLIIVGIIIVFVGLAFALRNMLSDRGSRDSFEGFDNMFKHHIGAMIVMAFGGLLSIIGLALFVVRILSNLSLI